MTVCPGIRGLKDASEPANKPLTRRRAQKCYYPMIALTLFSTKYSIGNNWLEVLLMRYPFAALADRFQIKVPTGRRRSPPSATISGFERRQIKPLLENADLRFCPCLSLVR